MATNLIYNLPKAEILAQLAEETSELAQAALKLRRAIDKENPTPKSQAEATDDLIEEMHCKSKQTGVVTFRYWCEITKVGVRPWMEKPHPKCPLKSGRAGRFES